MPGNDNDPSRKALEALRRWSEQQRRLVQSPALKAFAEQQKRWSEQQRRLVQSPALKAFAEQQRRLVESPALKALAEQQKRWSEQQRRLVQSPALKALAEQQRRLAEEQAKVMRSPALKALAEQQKRWSEQQRRLLGSPALKAFADQQRRLVQSPALKALAEQQKRWSEQQRRLVDLPALKVLAEQQRHVQAGLRSAILGVFESIAAYVDKRWAELETEHPDHPQPVLFLVASFSVRTGLPLYRAVKLRDDDAQLLDSLEPVVTDPAFVAEVQAAIHAAPHLNQIQKRHLVTAFDWLAQGQYVDAYPPFYNGLEPAFAAAARALNIIDSNNRFTTRKGKARKVEDLFEDLITDVRYKRFLRAWIFGDRGNPFRHGDVSDPSECRRQSLRLAAAVIGWLEIFGGWTASDFQARLEAEASRRLSLPSGA